MTDLNGVKVAVLAADGVEQEDMVAGWKSLREAGAQVTLVSIAKGRLDGFIQAHKSSSFIIDKTVAEAAERDFDGLIIPGGERSVTMLKNDPGALAFASDFMAAGKPVAAVCYGPQVLLEAGTLKGRTVTSHPALREAIEEAGGTWIQRKAHADQALVTAHDIGDLVAFMSRFANMLASNTNERKTDMLGEQSFPASDATATY